MAVLRARVLAPRSPTQVEWWSDGFVALEEGRIVQAGPYDGRPVDADLRPGVLLPGFVDAHVHFPQARVLGRASGPLLTWLDQVIFPEEARFADPAHARRTARLMVAQLAAAGTTSSLIYGSVHTAASHTLLSALDAAGLRARVGPVLMDEHCPAELQLNADEALHGLEGLVSDWHRGPNDKLEVAVIPRFALSCSSELMRRAGEFADHHGLWVSTHLAETLDECAEARRRFRSSDYLKVYEDHGLLHDRTVFAHCLHLSESEWNRLADAGAVVAHCPDANDFLGSGGLQVEAVLERGIELCVGTDVAAGRTFRIPRVLSSAYDNASRQGVSLAPELLLWWGTRGGALALGWPETGALEPGLHADLVLLDVPPWAEDLPAVLDAILFDHDAPTTRRVWVGGEVVWDRASYGHPWDAA